MPTTCSDWTSRSVPECWGPERLAAYVESAVSAADGMLFTATPREELEGIGRFAQLRDQAWVGMVREIVAAWNRASDAQREFAADEVALAIGAAPGTGARLLGTALSAAALPGLLEAVSAGMLTERHVMAVLRELDAVSLLLEQRQALVLLMLSRFAGETPGELRKLVRKLVLLIDLPAARDRESQATVARRVRFYPDVDGQAVLHARGPLAMVAAIKASLEATLGERVEGDDRSRDEREFDLFFDLLTGSEVPSGWRAHVVVPFSTAVGGEVELADVPGFGPILPSTARDLLEDALSVTPVSVDEDAIAMGVGDDITFAAPAAPAAPETPGADRTATAAPPASTGATTSSGAAFTDLSDVTDAADLTDQGDVTDAADVTDQGDVGRAAPVVDPVREAILAMGRAPVSRATGTSSYRVPRRVQRFLEARDRTCVFPGCHRPAADTDTDHRIPWPAGPTSPENLQCLCRHHHRAKQAVFTVECIDGDYRWTTRGGWSFWRRRQGY